MVLIMKRNFEFLNVYFRTFGFKPKFIFFLLFRLFFRTFIEISCFFDRIFFSDSKKQKLKNPVFIMGHPRSGTTFLHRFIAENNSSFRGIKLWELLIPSIFARNLISPLFKMFPSLTKKKLYDPAIHKTGFMFEETDDAAVFFRYFDGLFYWLFVSAWKKNPTRNIEQELKKIAGNEKNIRFLNVLYRKHMLNDNRRLISKSFSFIFNLEEIKKSNPDAKFIFMVRDPMETIPSAMSLERSIQNQLNGFSGLKKEKQLAYFGIVYQASQFFYKSFEEIIENKEDSILVITYNRLKMNFGETMKEIIGFTGMDCDEQFLDKIKEQEARQKSFASEHKYSPEEFGLSEEMIKRDFDFIYRKYNF